MSFPAPSTPAAEGAEPARSFQHYEILRREDGSPWELGRGTMGVTYKAFDVNLCCEVALKVVNAALLDSVPARERFVREAKAAASLRHRNVASVYHLGNDGERFFYAMEFIDGETLDALVRRKGPLPVDLTLRLLLQTARALAAAGRQNLVHRDIKPANLMVTHEDADDHMIVKVIDFGLARLVSGKSGGSSGQLTAGGFAGTPQFASPEQLEEKSLDVRSDIYSLGVTAWFLLAGSAPFTGSLATICQKHLNEKPPWGELPDWLPKAVRCLLAHMLEKDPARRPQDAVALRREIEDCVAAVKAHAADGIVTKSRAEVAAEPSAWEGGGEEDDAGSIVDRLTLVSGEPTPVGRWLFGMVAAGVVFVAVVAGVWIALAQRLPSRATAVAATPAAMPSLVAHHQPVATPRPTVPPPLPREKTRALPPTTPVAVAATPLPTAMPGKLVAVRVRSVPSSAEIRCEGRTLGTTPLEVELPPGVHELTARYGDWPEARETVVLADGQSKASADIHLTPPTPAAKAELPTPAALVHGNRSAREISVTPTAPVETRVEQAQPVPVDFPTPTPRPEPEVRRALPPLTPFDPDGTPEPRGSPGGN